MLVFFFSLNSNSFFTGCSPRAIFIFFKLFRQKFSIFSSKTAAILFRNLGHAVEGFCYLLVCFGFRFYYFVSRLSYIILVCQQLELIGL